jgi:putative flippase GtrA
MTGRSNDLAEISTAFSSKEYGRFGRFLAVGTLGTLLDFGALSSLKTLGLATLLANSLSFSAGLVNNFTLNRIWTFSDRLCSDWKRQFLQFTSVSLVGLALNNTLVMLLEVPLGEWLGVADYGYLPAKAVATAVVVFWNYFANRYWTFNVLNAEIAGHIVEKLPCSPRALR